MTIHLPQDKKCFILNAINKFKEKNQCKIRELSRIIGLLVSACPAVQYGWLHTKRLEREKYLSLKQFNGKYNARIAVSRCIRNELVWWELNIER